MVHEYDFNSFENAINFIKPLILEGGYVVSVVTVYKEFPREGTIDHFHIIIRHEVEEEEEVDF